MNSASRGPLLARVTSALFAPRSALPHVVPATYLLDPIARTLPSFARILHTQSTLCTSDSEVRDRDTGVIKRIFKKYGSSLVYRSRLKRSGYYLYETVTEQIDYPKFFTEFNMSDTFFSWFLITELHVWMLMVRTMAEGSDGQLARNIMVEAMWEDSTLRAKTIWTQNASGLKKQLIELSEQFNCAIIGYDEGINSEDKVLAGAIWRRFFQLERNNPEDIEKLLIYIRKQIQYLDNVPALEILQKPSIKWLSLNDS